MVDDTQRLIERCIRREEEAWREFTEKFSGLLYYSAQERLRRGGFVFSRQDIEDIVQAVFMELWERGRLEDVRDRKKITGWLSIMAQTRALNYMRQKKERLLRSEEFFKLDSVDEGGVGKDRDLLIELEEAIAQFDEKEKLIFKLNIIYGKTHREISGFMNIPVNTVSTIIARKKKMLKERFKKWL